MKNYRLFDSKEKQPLNSVNYPTWKSADEDKTYFLDAGNYPDEPHTVIEIHEYEDNSFVSDVTNQPATA